jgi:hypothetical protein
LALRVPQTALINVLFLFSLNGNIPARFHWSRFFINQYHWFHKTPGTNFHMRKISVTWTFPYRRNFSFKINGNAPYLLLEAFRNYF